MISRWISALMSPRSTPTTRAAAAPLTVIGLTVIRQTSLPEREPTEKIVPLLAATHALVNRTLGTDCWALGPPIKLLPPVLPLVGDVNA